MGSTWDSFANHKFFKVFDFELLGQKRIEPIFVPSSQKTNFDATYDVEKQLLETAPLRARARCRKRREPVVHPFDPVALLTPTGSLKPPMALTCVATRHLMKGGGIDVQRRCGCGGNRLGP
ncbi:hypothetical protein EDB80DRAFT_228113 [Ilyonectria destructans]|nr:hypothetical protein EDB80DRAFT_228113 [Ilyonectria destructans]